MGDIADFYIDQMMDAYPEWGSPYSRPRGKPPSKGHAVTCKHCGTRGLEWGNDGRKWYLIDPKGNAHVCGNDNAADDFEVLP